jgi:putative nucleotidyltransferase with HDIG domain
MDGAELLDRVMARHPWIVRIVLSGYSEKELILKTARPAHQFLSKPCDPEALKNTVARACALRKVINNQALRQIVSSIDSLPAMPDLYFEITRELQRETSSTASVGRIIARDAGMTASLLKMVSCSFFSFSRRISSPEEAVVLLGLDVVRGLILSAHLLAVYDKSKVPELSLPELWAHCMRVATMTEQIAKAENLDREQTNQAFIAGLLHDMGKLLLADKLSEAYRTVLDTAKREKRIVWEVEREVLNSSHAEVGAYLLGLWGLPDDLLEAIVFHHNPSAARARKFRLLTAVHAADYLDHEFAPAHEDYARPPLDEAHLAALKLGHRLPAWREMHRQYLEEHGKARTEAP